MVKDLIFLQMGIFTQVNIMMENHMVMVSINGKILQSMLESSKMV